MKKIILVLAIFTVVFLSQLSFAEQSNTTAVFNEYSTIDQDPPNSTRVLINGVWYIVVFDSYGGPIEVIPVPIRN
ncbi:MAG: hypothetical protein PHN88_04240 [Ignavibacteria bacterium]|nr:hypothetical protein [Ignavibacteria bacterium]